MIRSVSIINWKKHKELSMSFEEGVHFLVGPNGIGKTSILDAICFALLGDIGATAIYKNIEYKDLIRDLEKDMEITLTFCPPGKGEYTVTRSKPAHGNRRCTLSQGGDVLATRWDQATEDILELYGTTDLFLRRIMLLSEGDTFAYSTQPPGEGLTTHIENVLGINRMETLRDRLRRLGRDFDAEITSWRAKVEEVKEFTEEDRRREQQMVGQLEALKRDREGVSDTRDSLYEQIGALTSNVQKAEGLIAQVKSVIDEWTPIFGDPPQSHEFLDTIETLRESFDRKRAEVLTQRDSLKDELSWLAAQMDSQRGILEIVEPLEEEFKEVPCPVCKRPLTADMVRNIKSECRKMLEEFEERKESKGTQLPIVDRQLHEIESKARTLVDIQSRVRLILEQEPRTLSISTLESYFAELIEQQSVRQSESEQLKDQTTQMDEQIRSAEQELAELRRRIDERERLEMVRSLTCATKGYYVSQLFLESLEAALADQRRTLLEPLMEELSAMWSVFIGIDVCVEFKDDAQLMMVDRRTGDSLDFPQLSGGEKTALLIFTQTLLCKYFSRADFMLLDEPLEHLDARNRWALIRFLVDTAKRGYPKQLIITTVEEALIREYLDNEEVRVNVLSEEHPPMRNV